MKWLVRKSVYVPTWQGCLLILGSLVFVGLLLLFNVYGFLAVDRLLTRELADNQPVVLVVEGWVPDNVIGEAERLSQLENYPTIAVTGGPTNGTGDIIGSETFAEFGAKRLGNEGIAKERMLVVPSESVDRRRTYRMALDLKAALEAQGPLPNRIDIVTADVHARRSRLIYQRALGKTVSVGVRGVAPEDFDPDRWWVTSEGIKTVTVEAMSLCYELIAPLFSKN